MQQSCSSIDAVRQICRIECGLQEAADVLKRLTAASKAISTALSNTSQLQQQVRMVALTQPSTSILSNHQLAEHLHQQTQPLIHNMLHSTYTALQQEFQTNVLYKVICMP